MRNYTKEIVMHEPFVVVGIDDSDSARTALAWAIDWARRTRAHLKAVHVIDPALDISSGWYPGSMGWVPVPHTEDDPISQRQRTTELFDNLAAGQPSATLEYAEGPVGPALVQAARGAALLVIGTRQLRGIVRALDGSVSHYCLSHAACPVLAVPAVPKVPHGAEPTAEREPASS
jgi:nucleotide-binding universal stress UspA family protein